MPTALRDHPSTVKERKSGEPVLSAAEQTRLSWARPVRSLDELPPAYRGYFEAQLAGETFPYSVLTPTFVLSNFHRAVKPAGYFYFTVETTSEEILQKAYADAQQAGLPSVYGEWAYEGGYHGDWAQAGGYHYYPKMGQVREWLEQAGSHLIVKAEGGEYHHFLVQKCHLIKPQLGPDSHR